MSASHTEPIYPKQKDTSMIQRPECCLCVVWHVLLYDLGETQDRVLGGCCYSSTSCGKANAGVTYQKTRPPA